MAKTKDKDNEQVFTNYIPLSRKIFDHEFWTEERTFSRAEAWIDIVRSASWDSNNSRIIKSRWVTWKRGQWPVSLRFLADRWKWSRNKASKFLEDLRRQNMIEIVTDEGTAQTIITVCKYDEYNPTSKKSGQQTGQRSDSEGTVKGQRRDKVNNSNNSNNDNKEYNEAADAVSDTPSKEDEELFEKFKKWIVDYAPRVGQMSEPITSSQYSKLRKDFPTQDERTELGEVLMAMHNHKELLKKYTSANLTLRNWYKLRNQNKVTTNGISSNTEKLKQSLQAIKGQAEPGNDVDLWKGTAAGN